MPAPNRFTSPAVRTWAASALRQYFASERSYTPRTVAQLLAMLDASDRAPEAYIRQRVDRRTDWRRRYRIVQLTLRIVAANDGTIVTGTTIGPSGKLVRTYARARQLCPTCGHGLSADNAHVASPVKPNELHYDMITEGR